MPLGVGASGAVRCGANVRLSSVSSPASRYDSIGQTYARTRREDPYIAHAIHGAIGVGSTVVNIGAGTGNYEPRDRAVVAVEPSWRMIAQRAVDAAPVVQAAAENLPFSDATFDIAMAILTVHHWSDPAGGLAQMRRVARRQVVFYFEPLVTHHYWGLDYFPTATQLPSETNPPGEQLLCSHLDVHEIRRCLVPRDCVDGFGTAFWARPEEMLNPEVQAGMSWLALLAESDRRIGTEHLRRDLESGEWDRRFGHLRTQDFYDGGYRIAIAGE